jgi:hypothetical protein
VKHYEHVWYPVAAPLRLLHPEEPLTSSIVGYHVICECGAVEQR